MISLAQLSLIIRIFCLVASQLAIAFDLETFVLCHKLLDSGSQLDPLLLRKDEFVLVVTLHSVDLFLGFLEDG